MKKSQMGLAAWGFREMPLEETLALARRLGLAYVELSIANGEKDPLGARASSAEIGRVAALFREYKISPHCACTGNDFTVADPHAVAGSLEKVMAVTDVAAALGVKWLRVFAGFSPRTEVTGPRFEALCRALQTAAAHAHKKSLTLVLETHGGVSQGADGVRHFESISTHGPSLEKMLSAAGSGLALAYDPANLFAVGLDDPKSFTRQFGDHIAYVHLKDFAPTPGGFWQPAACGEGGMNWPGVLGALENHRGPALIEYEIPKDVVEGTVRSLGFLEARGALRS